MSEITIDLNGTSAASAGLPEHGSALANEIARRLRDADNGRWLKDNGSAR